jgi:hypothetical protein
MTLVLSENIYHMVYAKRVLNAISGIKNLIADFPWSRKRLVDFFNLWVKELG